MQLSDLQKLAELLNWGVIGSVAMLYLANSLGGVLVRRFGRASVSSCPRFPDFFITLILASTLIVHVLMDASGGWADKAQPILVLLIWAVTLRGASRRVGKRGATTPAHETPSAG